MQTVNENPAKGMVCGGLIGGMLWVLLGAAVLLWASGCVAKGSWEYGGTIPLLGEWKVYSKITPPKEGELPTVLTFEDKVMDWIVGPVTGAPSTEAVGATETNPTP